MNFSLNQLKIEQLVGYFNDEVIDLTPPFQRGRVWNSKLRRGLIRNILQGKPVPAIFLYKKREGAKNNFVILDGKQRLESILMYIWNNRPDLNIKTCESYIFGKEQRARAGFKAEINGENRSVLELDDEDVSRFRDYSLSIIEIEFDEDTTLGEIIQLFVDINQSGVKVTPFDIVKALYLDDPFLKQVFGLIAIEQKRKKDSYFKEKSSPYAFVLKRLDVVERLADQQNRIDLMWARLCEIALYAATTTHRKPSNMLKDFISKKSKQRQPKLSAADTSVLKRAFLTVKDLHKTDGFSTTRWATDQTHFYILIVSLIRDLKEKSQPVAQLGEKLVRFDDFIERAHSISKSKGLNSKTAERIKEYAQLSTKQTTDAVKRHTRELIFREVLQLL